MQIQNTHKIIIGAVSVIVVVAVSYVLLGNRQPASRQQMIHEKGQNVMPFSLDKTQHIFKKTENGGTQSVVVRDPGDTQDLSLIRMHLQMEAQNFAQGNFSDPTGLHGESMAGISVLKTNYTKMKVTYSEIENGAKIDFETTDTETLSAIHAWFDAQVSDHGSDAVTQ
ncbi:MAG: hypothetical protein A2845_06000 [Candidatus Lloydbacteria bacterium RIFCSPHIGHO2_01_FULL_49_22]|uniref:Aspartate carbamoyltransferase n=1 Tax=Candidatus Lloydbacteria bacterium RIFCSPHIGHO2_01_FULL_49_22 TaxID=1798658 RepID=A0A1G2CY06_9BACT|nr:MAG: hypothetical protein A2845_06000 [Candidatus Lloydbacteria bacterium RIFCSPHIGHO2_01_FULL_49_22]OGZ09768.1 MAG: hypothetical protein A3C14_00015 [Candidatus Lloydbacteria bacterium RIFCSPHIGHO2_02_FULL_50_18]